MPNDEDKKLMIKHNMINRAPGKRQIKPTAYLLNCDIPLDDDEDDDYQAPAKAPEVAVVKKEEEEENEDEEGDEEDVEDEGGSSSGSDDSDEEHEDEVESEEESEEEETAAAEDERICSVCMNHHESLIQEVVIQCDRCGIQVHEGCYGGVFLENENGNSDESWFCEPCLFLLDDIHCELCPSKTGAFKLSEFPGQYIHMVCALFTENVTWADNQKLVGASYQEVKHKFFGRKGCAGCDEWMESRTGVASRCELGDCSNYYHVTCAQKLGLLVESVDEGEGPVAHPRFIACKTHNRNTEKVKKQKDLYSRWLAREKQRAKTGIAPLTAEAEKDRLLLKKKLEMEFAELKGVSITKPDPYCIRTIRQRYGRPLHTSSRVLEGFKLKAQLYRPLSDQNGDGVDEKSMPNGTGESVHKQITRLTKENQKLTSNKKILEKERDKTLKDHEKYNLKYKQRKVKTKKELEKENSKLKAKIAELTSTLEEMEESTVKFGKAMERCGLPKTLVEVLGEPEDMGEEEEEEEVKKPQEKKESPPTKRRRKSAPVTPPEPDDGSSSMEEFIIIP